MVAVVFEAAPDSRAFSAGVAIEEHVAETIYQMLESFHNIFRALEVMAKPVVALVDGAALGGGCELVAACDIVIASERARFGQPEIKLGVFPPVAAILLPRVIGERRARELILTGELIGAPEAFGSTRQLRRRSRRLEAKAEMRALRDLSAPALNSRVARSTSRRKRLQNAARVRSLLNDLMKRNATRRERLLEKRKPLAQC